MAQHFYDTSAVVKHYRSELGTANVDRLLADTVSSHFLSNLAVVEVHSVFARLVRTGQITSVEFHRLRGRLLSDVASGPWRVAQVTTADRRGALDRRSRRSVGYQAMVTGAPRAAQGPERNVGCKMTPFFTTGTARMFRHASSEARSA